MCIFIKVFNSQIKKKKEKKKVTNLKTTAKNIFLLQIIKMK
jgi:hypothetical protein